MLNTFSPRSSFQPSLRRLAHWLLLPACLAVAALLALIGEQFRALEHPGTQVLDASRDVLFQAAEGGAVRALQLRHTVGELGVLRSAARHEVRDLALDDSGRHLWVLGDDATYHYDARSLQLIEHKPLNDAASRRFARVDAHSAELASVERTPVLARRDAD